MHWSVPSLTCFHFYSFLRQNRLRSTRLKLNQLLLLWKLLQDVGYCQGLHFFYQNHLLYQNYLMIDQYFLFVFLLLLKWFLLNLSSFVSTHWRFFRFKLCLDQLYLHFVIWELVQPFLRIFILQFQYLCL